MTLITLHHIKYLHNYILSMHSNMAQRLENILPDNDNDKHNDSGIERGQEQVLLHPLPSMRQWQLHQTTSIKRALSGSCVMLRTSRLNALTVSLDTTSSDRRRRPSICKDGRRDLAGRSRAARAKEEAILEVKLRSSVCRCVSPDSCQT